MPAVQALHLSHVVIASLNVVRITEFFAAVFGLLPKYANDEFADFVLPSGARIAFFKPTGKTSLFFEANAPRSTVAFGVTVSNVNDFYRNCLLVAEKFQLTFSGPPKDHPWGEASFLLIDSDANRWEITQSPTEDGTLAQRGPLTDTDASQG